MQERRVNGLRKSPYYELTAKDIAKLKADITAIGADATKFIFNQGQHTCYIDDADIILVCGDVLPDNIYSIHPRDMMSARAVLAHEYYGHRAYQGTPLSQGSWNDEFRASYMAARNAPGLTEQDRVFLIMDAMERAKTAGVTISWNSFMRSVAYCINDEQPTTQTH